MNTKIAIAVFALMVCFIGTLKADGDEIQRRAMLVVGDRIFDVPDKENVTDNDVICEKGEKYTLYATVCAWNNPAIDKSWDNFAYSCGASMLFSFFIQLAILS